jgi:predicted nucleic acid-binding protein
VRIYLDVCCLNRPFDDQSQGRIRRETDAVKRILEQVADRQHVWVTSAAVTWEIARCSDAPRRAALQALAELATDHISLDEQSVALAHTFAKSGVRGIDALHLALAQLAGCEVLLTTDNALVQRARRLSGRLSIRVRNPIEWIHEDG